MKLLVKIKDTIWNAVKETDDKYKGVYLLPLIILIIIPIVFILIHHYEQYYNVDIEDTQKIFKVLTILGFFKLFIDLFILNTDLVKSFMKYFDRNSKLNSEDKLNITSSFGDIFIIIIMLFYVDWSNLLSDVFKYTTIVFLSIYQLTRSIIVYFKTKKDNKNAEIPLIHKRKRRR